MNVCMPRMGIRHVGAMDEPGTRFAPRPLGRPEAKMTVFNNPHLLGFDHFERILDRAAKASA
jgi:hypothetical protein